MKALRAARSATCPGRKLRTETRDSSRAVETKNVVKAYDMKIQIGAGWAQMLPWGAYMCVCVCGIFAHSRARGMSISGEQFCCLARSGMVTEAEKRAAADGARLLQVDHAHYPTGHP